MRLWPWYCCKHGPYLVRLVYLDEAGSDHQAPFLAVAGVIVHGDRQWSEVDGRLAELRDRYVDEEHRSGFVFHAKDIFHGNNYFDSSKPEWSDPRRRSGILDDLAKIIEDVNLPVVAAGFEKVKIKVASPQVIDVKKSHINIHNLAILSCLIRVDKWLSVNAPDELGMIIHEDGTPAKSLVKSTVRFARNAYLIEKLGAGEIFRLIGLALPLTRIMDTVHFVEKPDAGSLQLADLCAFMLGRISRNLRVPKDAAAIMFKSAWWMADGRELNLQEALDQLGTLAL